ncbi:protein YIPF5-like [Saccoglossus kowalevskii]|uniref:Protein YIPF n=1 Tax=Saccoglossus kowalevskii TaxID=10224 RepID=A0ABM0GK70_SACKO|nr:PREDICTED: protein YIPF5-like [Saccoglossus kowalevskii]
MAGQGIDQEGFYQTDYNYEEQPQAGYDMGGTEQYVDNQYGAYGYSQQAFGQPPMQPGPSPYMGQIMTPGTEAEAYTESFDDEPPLLEELGINFEHIYQKTLSVMNPFRDTDPAAIHDCDLAGPLVFAIMFGATLLLAGKVHFGYIYGIGGVGCVAVWLLLNMMSLTGVSFNCIVSVLGYCLLPMVFLSTFAILFSLQGLMGNAVAFAAIVWCSISSSKLFVTALAMDSQQLLVAYPCALLYGVFALLTVF